MYTERNYYFLLRKKIRVDFPIITTTVNRILLIGEFNIMKINKKWLIGAPQKHSILNRAQFPALSQIVQFCILYEIRVFYSVKKYLLIFENNFKPRVFVMKINNLVSRCSIQLSSFWDKSQFP